MQNKYKKVQNIYIDLDAQSLLQANRYETRLGLCMRETHKKHAVIKIIHNDNQPQTLRLIEALKNMVTLSQQLSNCPHLVECYSKQRTPTTFYFAFKHYKDNLTKITLQSYEILHLLASMIQVLKLFQVRGECHGNFKPSNIFLQKKLNSAVCFTTSDFSLKQYSNGPTEEFTDPEIDKPSIESDIYSLGKICIYVMKERKCTFQSLLNSMTNSKNQRIQLEQLEIEVEKLIENYEQKNLRFELNQRGITEDVLNNIIKSSIQKSFRSINEFETKDRDFSLRSRSQFLYMLSQKVRKLQSIDQNLIDCFVLGLLSESYLSLLECKKITKNEKLKQLVIKDIDSMENYLDKIALYTELFAQDLILKDADPTFFQDFTNQYGQPNTLLKRSISLVVQDIINKNLSKEIEHNEVVDKEEVQCLNCILYTNQMKEGISYDYKQLQQYIESLLQVI